MLSGLNQKPQIAIGVVPLVQFWGAGVEAFRTHMTYAVETRISGDRLLNVYRSQTSLLRHIHNEVSGFDRKGWGAHTVFRKRYPLAEDEKSIVSRFRHDVLNREFRALRERLETFDMDRDYDRLTNYIREEHRLFPALRNIFKSLIGRHSLEASKRGIRIRNVVEGSQQFVSPEVHSRAKALFESILEDAVEQTADGFPIEITMVGSMVAFRYRGKEEARGEQAVPKSIQESAEALDWRIDVKTSHRGTKKVAVIMAEESFATDGVVAKRKSTAQNLMTLSSVSHADIIALAGLFVRKQPFYGYTLITDDKLDISGTPTYQVIESGRKLIEPIAHNMVQSLDGASAAP